jgi:peptidoglycan-associated lipoprotein
MIRQRPALALTATLLLGACHHAAPVATTPVPAPATASRADTAPPAITDAMRRQMHADSVRRQVLAEADSARLRADLAAIDDRIQFDFNRWDLDEADLARLEAKRAALAAHPGLTLRIAGNADDRGPDEYNLALGLHRAAAAKRWLEEHGIAADRITIVSYGEEQPLDSRQTEAAWALNRRDDFIVIGRGN